MRRDELEHAIRTACQIIGHTEVIVVGSQSVLGTYRHDQLPREATMSAEVDILPIADDAAEVSRLADLIEGVAGEFSPFEHLHGFSIDGVDLTTCVLPTGWRERLVRVRNSNTTAPGGEPQFTGWCLDAEDLCVALRRTGEGPQFRRSPPREWPRARGHRGRATEERPSASRCCSRSRDIVDPRSRRVMSRRAAAGAALGSLADAQGTMEGCSHRPPPPT